jgi:predicted nucleotidyltransferase
MDPSLNKNAILSVRLFGSRARGDAEECSDTDILCVVDAVTEDVKAIISELIHAAYGEDVSVSFYGRQRFSEMFAEGHLFAWHIFRESRFLHSFTPYDWIETLGEPQPYTNAVWDVSELAEIMATIPESLMLCPANAIYEGGLLYLCVRNIAMSLSWYSRRGLNFSRCAPIQLTDPFPEFPLSLDRYERYLECRLASTRGFAVGLFEAKEVSTDVQLCLEWTGQCLRILQTYEATF